MSVGVRKILKWLRRPERIGNIYCIEAAALITSQQAEIDRQAKLIDRLGERLIYQNNRVDLMEMQGSNRTITKERDGLKAKLKELEAQPRTDVAHLNPTNAEVECMHCGGTFNTAEYFKYERDTLKAMLKDAPADTHGASYAEYNKWAAQVYAPWYTKSRKLL